MLVIKLHLAVSLPIVSVCLYINNPSFFIMFLLCPVLFVIVSRFRVHIFVHISKFLKDRKFDLDQGH